MMRRLNHLVLCTALVASSSAFVPLQTTSYVPHSAQRHSNPHQFQSGYPNSHARNGMFRAVSKDEEEQAIHTITSSVDRPKDTGTKIVENKDAIDETNSPTNRRMALASLLAAPVLAVSSAYMDVPNAAAYDKTYPIELTADEGDKGRQRKKDQIMEKEVMSISPLAFGPQYKPLSSILWGAALWLLSGSRSNPVVTPLANVLYDEKSEEWLKDRNDGLFGDIPAPFYIVLAIVFIVAGFAFDELLLVVTEGDRNISLQLAGVSLISGASLELGRIASGEKKQTRNESDRSLRLQQEFEEFANSRLAPGGNVHRNEVVQAFRRFNPKYRQADSEIEEYALGDLEIEQLLRQWSRPKGNVKMSSAGFYSGIQINQDADVFVSR